MALLKTADAEKEVAVLEKTLQNLNMSRTISQNMAKEVSLEQRL